MNEMKRIITLILSAIFILSLTSCAGIGDGALVEGEVYSGVVVTLNGELEIKGKHAEQIIEILEARTEIEPQDFEHLGIAHFDILIEEYTVGGEKTERSESFASYKYGQIVRDGKQIGAHKELYEWLIGVQKYYKVLQSDPSQATIVSANGAKETDVIGNELSDILTMIKDIEYIDIPDSEQAPALVSEKARICIHFGEDSAKQGYSYCIDEDGNVYDFIHEGNGMTVELPMFIGKIEGGYEKFLGMIK